jgi:hypothetical protein
MANINLQVGPTATTTSLSAALAPVAQAGNMGDLIVSELHGRFYTQVYRGGLMRIGTTAIVTGTANHGTANGGSATLGTAAAATPMLGVWNPAGSGKNLVIAQAAIEAYINTVTTPTSFGAFVWYVSLNNGAISTGLTPFNSATLAAASTGTKGFAGATALTGLSNVFTALEVADLQAGGQAIAYGTIGNTSIVPNMASVQNFDGQLIVPPGAVLALYNTGASTTFSYTGRLVWEEIPT